MSNNKIKIETYIDDKNKTILHQGTSEINGIEGSIHREFIDLKEEATKQSLNKLGWVDIKILFQKPEEAEEGKMYIYKKKKDWFTNMHIDQCGYFKTQNGNGKRIGISGDFKKIDFIIDIEKLLELKNGTKD